MQLLVFTWLALAHKRMRRFARFWYHLYKLENVKNTHGVALLLVKLQAEAWNFTKNNTIPWVFLTFLKFCEWYQISQSITYVLCITCGKGKWQTIMKKSATCYQFENAIKVIKSRAIKVKLFWGFQKVVLK